MENEESLLRVYQAYLGLNGIHSMMPEVEIKLRELEKRQRAIVAELEGLLT